MTDSGNDKREGNSDGATQPDSVIEGKMSHLTAESADVANAENFEAEPPVDDYTKLFAEKEEIHAQLIRTMADFQNFRKRTQQEVNLNRQYATESLIMTLLPVLDNFERTVRAADNGATLEATVVGVKAVEKQFRFLIEQQGVQRMDLVGKPFNANEAEAIVTYATADVPADTVMEEIEPGYRLGNKVVRPARVKISVEP